MPEWHDALRPERRPHSIPVQRLAPIKAGRVLGHEVKYRSGSDWSASVLACNHSPERRRGNRDGCAPIYPVATAPGTDSIARAPQHSVVSQQPNTVELRSWIIFITYCKLSSSTCSPMAVWRSSS